MTSAAGLFRGAWAEGFSYFRGIIGLGALLLTYPLEVLTLAKGDRVLFSKRVNPGDTFQLAFLHSIALSEVRDSFLIDSQYNIVLTETRFQGQGAGLPYNLSPGRAASSRGRLVSDYGHAPGGPLHLLEGSIALAESVSLRH